ncbi:MAG: RluA family pseudouridine synthase [Clostridia bacterium]|nr:RluA family pseudouridine synthase [Clostridia bacterium]
MTDPQILYRDADLVVVNKPVGMPVSPEKGQTPDLFTAISDRLKREGEPPLLFLVHRLDRTTGGVMALARTGRAAAALGETFAAHRLNKIYLAVVEGETDEEGEIVSHLRADTLRARACVVAPTASGARPARLTYVTLDRRAIDGRPASLIRVSLDTGRFHQIRAQFSFVGHPLFGDRKYGAVTRGGPALFSACLSFHHPLSGETLTFCAAPSGPPFDLFDPKCLLPPSLPAL